MWPPGTLQAASCGGGDGGPPVLLPVHTPRSRGSPARGSRFAVGKLRHRSAVFLAAPCACVGVTAQPGRAGVRAQPRPQEAACQGGKRKSDFPIRGGRDRQGLGAGARSLPPSPALQTQGAPGNRDPQPRTLWDTAASLPGTSAPCLSLAQEWGSHPPGVIHGWAPAAHGWIPVGKGQPAPGWAPPAPALWDAPASGGQGSWQRRAPASSREGSRMQPLMGIAEGT